MGNACLRSSEIHHHQEEEDEDEIMGGSLASKRLNLLRKKKLQQSKAAFSSPSSSSSSSSAMATSSSSSSSSSSRSLVVPVEMKPAMEILPSSQEGVMRVKLIISTNQMASMINASYKKDDFLESLITSLLKEKGINIPEQQQHKLSASSSRKSSFSSWKPALESIPEVRSS
ncbi:hypothetical protein SELMODRAFT_419314 [Selaginella moellendorffii]|uniref:Uncharacterized protein n=1 Tax=Selaginella moellendorffii TaxID=88036 RepID=D8S8I7_SELML|nr:putative protein TPRXL [Selaginella moellendorffii]EFJ19051.1 hypothetical protein SELMODRAFT_419314 [Selaginella moellendorffii]|eukprot:XP_002979649.1 putative protein TPRXL [Selaginella moellendorffii]